VPSITISQSAIAKIAKELKFRQEYEIGSRSGVPLLYYYQRSYSTLHDGTIIEHGDGFGLHFVDPADLMEQREIAYESIPIGDSANVIIGGPTELLSGGFEIDWSGKKFSLKPPASL
jgi:hypothetical protein